MLTDVTDQYETYLNDYTFDNNDNTSMIEQPSDNLDNKFVMPIESTDTVVPNISEFQQSEVCLI